MKKQLMAAVVLIIISQAVNAQTGSILVGGSLNFSSTKSPSTPDDNKVTNFNFSPTVGYQINDNWTAGLVADIGSNKYSYGNNTTPSLKSSAFDIGPFVRYAKSLSGVFAIYGQLQSTFGSEKNNGVKSTLANINAFPAVFINVKDGFGINFTVGGIGYNSSKPSGSSSTNTFSVTFGQSVGIGISKNFGGSKKK